MQAGGGSDPWESVALLGEAPSSASESEFAPEMNMSPVPRNTLLSRDVEGNDRDSDLDDGTVERQRLLRDTFNTGDKYRAPRLCVRGSHAIPLFYVLLGFVSNFPRVALREFCITTLAVSPATQQLILSVIMTFPWNFKILYGFVSDTVPICGQHRKPYMVIGVAFCSLSWVILGSMTAKPQVGTTCVLLFSATFGLIIADVMADTLVVERGTKRERGRDSGNAQTMCWCCRLLGQFVGLLTGGWAVSQFSWPAHRVFAFNGLVPLVALPSLWLLVDSSGRDRALSGARMTVSSKVNAVWDLMQNPRLWKPLIFVFVNAATPSSADAFVNFMLAPEQKGGLGINLEQYAYILAIGQVASMCGAAVYQMYLARINWRMLFLAVMLVSLPISLSQLVVIFRLHETWHVSAFAFLFGSEVVADTVGFLIQMPILIMSGKLCPDQVESTVFALSLSTNNIGLSVGSQLGASLTAAFGVTLDDMSHLWQLTVVCIVLGTAPIFLIPWLPTSADTSTSPTEGNKNRFAGIFLAALLGTSLLWSSSSAIIEVAMWGSGAVDEVVHPNATTLIGVGPAPALAPAPAPALAPAPAPAPRQAPAPLPAPAWL